MGTTFTSFYLSHWEKLYAINTTTPTTMPRKANSISTWTLPASSAESREMSNWFHREVDWRDRPPQSSSSFQDPVTSSNSDKKRTKKNKVFKLWEGEKEQRNIIRLVIRTQNGKQLWIYIISLTHWKRLTRILHDTPTSCYQLNATRRLSS